MSYGLCGMFQSTLPRGERPRISRGRNRLILFQSTLPRGERLVKCDSKGHYDSFNPRSRVGSDLLSVFSWPPAPVVSIHAPAWGATAGFLFLSVSDSVSIHAPAWGATTTYRSSSRTTCFNPRSRVGSDTHTDRDKPMQQVSIHAPAWGATRKRIHDIPIRTGFNPRSRVGSDRPR